MSESESSTGSEKEVVAVTKHGQATIPKRFRELLGIDAPGKVQFRETDDGVVVERVRSAREMQGFAAGSEGEESTDVPATELLREKRERDTAERDARFSRKEG